MKYVQQCFLRNWIATVWLNDDSIYLFAGRQEALEAAISERDAQLGLLEVSGIKTARAAERADDLRADRKRLMQMMKQQVIINDYGFLFL